MTLMNANRPLVMGGLIGGTIFAARLHPRVQPVITKLHRPAWQHLRGLALGMTITAGAAHLTLHGGF